MKDETTKWLAYADENLRSAEILLERGFGGLIGIESAEWSELTRTAYSYESIVEQDASIFGLANPRMTAQRCASRMLAIKPVERARIRSWICGADHKQMFPGTLRFSNESGGEVVILAYPLSGELQFFMGFFNVFRRIMLQRILLEIAPSGRLAMVEEHPMHVYRAPISGGTLFAAFNVIQDLAERLVLRVAGGQVSGGKLQILDQGGRWRRADARICSQGLSEQIIVNTEIPALEGLFLRSS